MMGIPIIDRNKDTLTLGRVSNSRVGFNFPSVYLNGFQGKGRSPAKIINSNLMQLFAGNQSCMWERQLFSSCQNEPKALLSHLLNWRGENQFRTWLGVAGLGMKILRTFLWKCQRWWDQMASGDEQVHFAKCHSCTWQDGNKQGNISGWHGANLGAHKTRMSRWLCPYTVQCGLDQHWVRYSVASCWPHLCTATDWGSKWI